MKLTAIDTLHISSVSAENIPAGAEFEISDEQGKTLVARGLAREGGQKAEPPVRNKAEPKPTNKAG